MKSNNTPSLICEANIDNKVQSYYWQKQEVFKGRDVMGGPDWAGWGFNRNLLQTRLYTAAEANAASNSVLMVEPVFDDDPDWMLETNQLSQVQTDQLLASGIPALSYAAGLINLGNRPSSKNFNMNDPDYSKVNGWPRTYGDDDELRWLHSDIKNMAYVYTWKLLEKIVEEGDLQ